MSRATLDSNNLHATIADQVNTYHKDTLDEIERALDAHDIVIVGMSQNPFVKRARKALTGAGKSFEYLEYGSYFGEWRRRLSIKMWSGWPTFPMVFIKGKLIGGAEETEKMIAEGKLDELLK